MERSRTQVLLTYLPGAVFVHESGLIAKTVSIRGEPTTSVNRQVLLGEIDQYLAHWPDDGIQGIARPSRLAPSDFQIITPELIRWELWPLKFECARESCGRIVSFRALEDIPRAPRCTYCRAPLRQLRYYSAHECGRIQDMYIPKCSQGHGYEHVYFEDTGTFRTAVFRCRACNNGIIRRTLQSPCRCVDPGGEHPMMRAYTVRDTRTYYTHRISLINLQSVTFNELQSHPARGAIAVASYLGLLGQAGSIRDGLAEANRATTLTTQTVEEWTAKERQLREMGWSERDIAEVKRAIGPREAGLTALAAVDRRIIDLGNSRPIVERAALFDTSELHRITLGAAHESMRARGEVGAVAAIEEALHRTADLGIEEIAVTWSFPIAMAAFGYTRGVSGLGEGVFQGFARAGAYDGKFPIFAVATDTEALLVTLSALSVVRWLCDESHGSAPVPENIGDARKMILEIFANREVSPEPAAALETLVHTISHVMLRALDDGQVGFAEASLAEWVVPETLTFALYANNLKSYTLGALWTLLNNRTLQWLNKSATGMLRCENDPLCHQRSPRACERCLYLTFGCPSFNDHLDRRLLASFWRNA
jgi:hypothetical protein